MPRRLLHWLFVHSPRPRHRRRRPAPTAAAWLPQYAEVLEERTLLSATLDGSGLLTILSTGQDDAIRESAKPDAGDDYVWLADPSSAQPPAGDEPFSILPYPGFVGGVRVAAGDVNDDGTPDLIVAAGPGGGPHVKIFDGATGSELRSVVAFDPNFMGGVYVAVGDINNDSFADIIIAADAGAGGGPHVKSFDGATGSELRGFFAFDPSFVGGVWVAAGVVQLSGSRIEGERGHSNLIAEVSPEDPIIFTAIFDDRFGQGGTFDSTNDDNTPVEPFIDIITSPGPSGGPHVRVFDGLSGDQARSFVAFDPSFSGGVFVAEGDVGSDNELELSIFGGDALEELFALLDGGTRLDTGRADINDVSVSQSPDDRDNTVFIMTVNPWVGIW